MRRALEYSASMPTSSLFHPWSNCQFEVFLSAVKPSCVLKSIIPASSYNDGLIEFCSTMATSFFWQVYSFHCCSIGKDELGAAPPVPFSGHPDGSIVDNGCCISSWCTHFSQLCPVPYLCEFIAVFLISTSSSAIAGAWLNRSSHVYVHKISILKQTNLGLMQVKLLHLIFNEICWLM